MLSRKMIIVYGLAVQFESNVYSVRLSDVDNRKIEYNCVFDILVSNLFAGNYVRYENLKVLL